MIPGPGRMSRGAALAELSFFLAVVASFIWIWGGAFQGSRVLLYVLGLGITLLSHIIHRETPEELGMRIDNVWPAMRDAAIPTVPLVAVLLVMGLVGGHLSAEALGLERLLRLLAWDFLQQYLLQAFIHRRLALLVRRPMARELAVGSIFALLHLPNPVLVPVTFAAGYIFSVLYRRHPNLLVLTLCHAAGSTAVAFAFDPGILHKMRVGPGYYRL